MRCGRLRAAVQDGELGQVLGVGGIQLIGLDAPSPVTVRGARRIDARLAAQVEHILQGNNRRSGDRGSNARRMRSKAICEPSVPR